MPKFGPKSRNKKHSAYFAELNPAIDRFASQQFRSINLRRSAGNRKDYFTGAYINFGQLDFDYLTDLKNLSTNVANKSVSFPVVQVMVIGQTAQEHGAADELIEQFDKEHGVRK